jgi:hypothetical protein
MAALRSTIPIEPIAAKGDPYLAWHAGEPSTGFPSPISAPVRSCGISWNDSAGLMCLEHLGLSAACAQTWLYNVVNTRRHCFSVCIVSWIKGEAPTRKDGRLNDCLECDEDLSGPVFKATAGRTRRNSGIQSSIPRPNEQIAPVVHDYVPDLAPC